MKSRREQGSLCVAARGAGRHQADRRQYAPAPLERGEVSHGWFAGKGRAQKLPADLLAFFADRLKVQLATRARVTISLMPCFRSAGRTIS